MFQGSSKKDLIEQFNNWDYDQRVFGDESFKITDALLPDEFGRQLSIWFEGEEYVDEQPAEPALDTQYSEFPTTTRQPTVEGGPTTMQVLIFIALMAVVVTVIVWAVSH